jgi:hypothetical protein
VTRLAHAAVISAVLAASGLLSVWGVLADMPGRPYLAAFLDQFAHAIAMAVVVVAIIAACERWPRRGAARVAVQATALLAGVILSAFGIARLAETHSVIAVMGVGSTDGLVPVFLWFGFAAAALLSWYYAIRERAARVIDGLAEESVLRHCALRRADEARLQALRARVDPALLDARLAEIHEAYRQGDDAGDDRLDSFIDYLTAALNEGGEHVRSRSHAA